MDIKRLFRLAGIQIDEKALTKYNEPRANHEKKLGGKEAKKPLKGAGKKGDSAKYAEPKTNHKVKTGGKNVSTPEGKLKTSTVGKYDSKVTNKGAKKAKVDQAKASDSKKDIKAPEGKLKVAPVSKYNKKVIKEGLDRLLFLAGVGKESK